MIGVSVRMSVCVFVCLFVCLFVCGLKNEHFECSRLLAYELYCNVLVRNGASTYLTTQYTRVPAPFLSSAWMTKHSISCLLV